MATRAPSPPVQDNTVQLGPAAPQPAPGPAAPPAPPAQGAANPAAAIAPPAQRNRAPRRPMASAPATTATQGASPSLLLVSNTPFYTEARFTGNTYVPSAITLGIIIGVMDYTMSHTYRFTQSSTNWLPPLSHAYFGVLFFAAILRAKREAGTLTMFQAQLLQHFEDQYSINNLLIPGPLVTLFKTITSFSGPHDWFGDISPTIPDTPGATAARHYRLTDNLHYVLPDVPYFIDRLQVIIATTADATTLEAPNRIESIFSQNASNTATTQSHLRSPGASFPITHNLAHYNLARLNLRSLGLPVNRLDVAATPAIDISNWAQYLGIMSSSGNQFHWFSNAAATMQRYSQYFYGSTTLGSIISTGLASASPIWTYRPNNTTLTTPFRFVAATNPATIPAHFTTVALRSNAATASNFDTDLEEAAEQHSAYSQINVSFTDSNVQHAPTDANLRSGPVWTLDKPRKTPVIDFALALPANITTHFHTDTRQ